DKTSPAIDVMFPVSDINDFQTKTGISQNVDGPLAVVIWTTTPWTLPANMAVAAHPEFDYQLIQCEKDNQKLNLIIAADLVASVLKRSGVEQHEVIAKFKGAVLEGLKLQHPFYQREVPVILGNHVTLEAGTGAVHTAPGHGIDDYVVGSKYGLEVYNPVGGNGCFLPDTELFAGENVLKANDHVRS